jgi:hypothetical protein
MDDGRVQLQTCRCVMSWRMAYGWAVKTKMPGLPGIRSANSVSEISPHGGRLLTGGGEMCSGDHALAAAAAAPLAGDLLRSGHGRRVGVRLRARLGGGGGEDGRENGVHGGRRKGRKWVVCGRVSTKRSGKGLERLTSAVGSAQCALALKPPSATGACRAMVRKRIGEISGSRTYTKSSARSGPRICWPCHEGWRVNGVLKIQKE